MSGVPGDDGRSGRRAVVALTVGALVGLVTVLAVLYLPVSVRHAEPFGNVQTVDFDRGIAVLGGEVRPNYPDFDRVGLDLRAYTSPVPDDQYDFVLTVMATDDGGEVRRVAFSVPAARIPATKSAFSPTGTSVSFEPIPDSAGRTFTVSLERGPRNADDVVTLWAIASYSSLHPIDVLQAAADGYDLGLSGRASRAIILLLMWLTLVLGATLVARIAIDVWSSPRASTGPAAETQNG